MGTKLNDIYKPAKAIKVGDLVRETGVDSGVFIVASDGDSNVSLIGLKDGLPWSNSIIEVEDIDSLSATEVEELFSDDLDEWELVTPAEAAKFLKERIND